MDDASAPESGEAQQRARVNRTHAGVWLSSGLEMPRENLPWLKLALPAKLSHGNARVAPRDRKVRLLTRAVTPNDARRVTQAVAMLAYILSPRKRHEATGSRGDMRCGVRPNPLARTPRQFARL